MNIDFKNITCFGFTVPKNTSWYVLARNVVSDGWKNVNKQMFEDDLNKNIKSSYQSMVSVSFKDLDTEFDYIAKFDNQLKLWKLELPDSSDDAIDLNDKKQFFKSENFKQFCKRADEILTEANKLCKTVILNEVKKGYFIQLDEIKLEAILDMLDNPDLRKNLKFGKYLT